MATVKPHNEGLSMAVEIGAKLDAIRDTVTEVRERQIQFDVHIKNIIGPPSLEDRLKKYVDDRKEHGDNNSDQKLMQVQKILELQTENSKLKLQADINEVKKTAEQTEKTREENHKDSTSRLRKVERNMYMAMGALTVIQVLIKVIFK